MREFETPLAERQRIARWFKERYHSDPEFRLRCINRSRAAQGLEPRTSVLEITSRSHGGKIASSRARRGEGGRFA